MFTNKLLLLALTAVGQTMFLGGMIAVNRLPHQFGETIRLKVEPVDPRDFFRGDYVILGYDFSRRQSPDTGDGDVYVVLKRTDDGDYYVTDSVAANPPQSGTFIRGRHEYGRITAGIEAYYVQEGRGREIEQAIRNRRPVFAEVSVWNGTAKLRRVVVE